jgi:hypothetical protein
VVKRIQAGMSGTLNFAAKYFFYAFYVIISMGFDLENARGRGEERLGPIFAF